MSTGKTQSSLAGYDGAVRGFVNPARTEKDLRKYHPEKDILLFRLD